MAYLAEPQTIVDPKDAAEYAGLSYASTDDPGIARRKSGTGFCYRDATGNAVTDRSALARIRSLVIPPAWRSVWICADPNGHIQAVGLDDRGRKQYRYHSRFREVRESLKYEHMMAFADALPALRERVGLDMSARGLGRKKVLASVVHLLETTMIRIGNGNYAKENKSYGLTTLQNRHVKVDGGELRFNFKGKSGKEWRLNIRDRRIAKVVKSCQDLPGQHLFQYIDENGERQAVTSADVNAYLREVSGSQITAKDFRTWTGTVLAAMALGEFEEADTKARAKRNVTKAAERVASMLGNTPAICRKCYIHPEIVNAYLDGGLLIEVQKEIDVELREKIETLSPEEAAVLSFLRARIAKELAASDVAASAPPAAKPAVRSNVAVEANQSA